MAHAPWALCFDQTGTPACRQLSASVGRVCCFHAWLGALKTRRLQGNLSIEGVVINEMRGAYSSPDTLHATYSQRCAALKPRHAR